MKKLIIPIFMLLVMAMSVSAQLVCFPPMPIYGKYDYFGERLDGQVLKIEAYGFNGELVHTIEAGVNSLGEYSEDLANIPSCYYRVKEVRIKACDDDPSCIVVKPVEVGSPGIRMDIIFTEKPLDSVPPDTIVIEKPVPKEVIVHRDKVVVKEVKVPTVVEREVEVPVEVPVDEGKDPLSYLLGGLIVLLATVLGLFSWGRGYEGLLKYWAKKDPKRAYKMAETVVKKYKAGVYSRKK